MEKKRTSSHFPEPASPIDAKMKAKIMRTADEICVVCIPQQQQHIMQVSEGIHQLCYRTHNSFGNSENIAVARRNGPVNQCF
eukprot:1389253-Amorphochlora_amoeboformis.AAC.2